MITYITSRKLLTGSGPIIALGGSSSRPKSVNQNSKIYVATTD